MRERARAVPQAASLSPLLAEPMMVASMSEAIAVSDCGEVPLRTVAPLASRSRAIAAKRSRRAPARQAGAGSGALGRRLVAGKAAKAPEACPVTERPGQRDIGKIIPKWQARGLEHRQGRPGLLAFRRRIERLEPEPQAAHRGSFAARLLRQTENWFDWRG
jgi:hypothetical protein